ncbi:WD40 repeat protein [Giardia duodenalis]|uniref:Intraflagellar transport protein 121 n=1 Tax=Giardia intestinalis (strain ATCC 50803 / WB clone C6) TaxID=184922 RepID=IF121_GIAIC|nr:WD40 repeat protein [Giardia intestinalis]A0A644F0T7.1 RecName: Full=Intraflagellar transport protein 121; Short=IFT121; AltName: Full=Tubby superfamily protein; AltName: Full=WD40 repeat protein [Giardia lamblia ATCC 50803]KAE8302175.1 WD40 repeat protein [Giardia intestinalis]
MPSTAFILKCLEFTDTGEEVVLVAWNKTENYIAAGGQTGSIRILLLDFNSLSEQGYNISDLRTSTRNVRILMDKKLSLHDNALITSIAWNEKETKLATSDNRGLVFISSTDTGKWVRNLVNDSNRAAVVTTTWSPDASRILMVYVNGLVMLGTASGHRIYNGTINKGSAPKFGLIASNAIEVFILAWGNAICCYNFSGEEVWSVSPLLATNSDNHFVHGCWGHSSESAQLTALSPSRDPACNGSSMPQIKINSFSGDSMTLIAVTSNGMLCVYSVLTGELLSSVSTEIIPVNVQLSPGSHMLCITGSVQSSDSNFGLHQLRGNQGVSGDSTKHTAIVVVYRTADLATISRLRLPERVATSSSWDSTGLRLVLAAGKNIYIATVRPSYNHYLMNDGTMAFTMSNYTSTILSTASFVDDTQRPPMNVGALFSKKTAEEAPSSAISSFEERILDRARCNECVLFWKPGLQAPYQRWPARMIAVVGCKSYIAILTLKTNTSGTRKHHTHICFYTSVCAPIFSIDLPYVPFYTAGSGNYLVCASSSRISVVDIRGLANEAIGLVDAENVSYVYEWHADSYPLAQDRELTVARLTVNNPIVGVACCDVALFVARQDERVQRYSLPSLTLLETMTIKPNQEYMQTNCNGTVLACLHEDGSLVFYYTQSYYSEFLYAHHNPAEQQQQKQQPAPKPPQAQAHLTLLDTDADTAAALGFGQDSVVETESAPYVIKNSVLKNVNVSSGELLQDSAQARSGGVSTIPPYSPELIGIWGLVFSPEDPNLVAVSSQYKVIVFHLDTQTREDSIQTSAHIIGFSGLSIIASYLDEVSHNISSLDHAYYVLETQMLRELQEIIFGQQQAPESFNPLVDAALNRGCLNKNMISLTSDSKSGVPSSLFDSVAPKTIAIKPVRGQQPVGDMVDSGLDVTASNSSQPSTQTSQALYSKDGQISINLAGAVEYVKSHPSVHLYRIVAEASLITLRLEVASYFYIRAGDYVSYNFCESLLRLQSQDQRRAEMLMLIGNFSSAEHVYKQVLGRPDLIVKTQTDLQMWLSIIRAAKLSRTPGGNLLIDDKLLEKAHKSIGLYYMRQQQYAIASDFLQKSGDPYLYAESLFAARRYAELKALAVSLPVDEFANCIAKVAVMLARLGDVEGASEALVRVNDPHSAVHISLQLKRFDIAAAIAGKHNILHIIDRELSVYLKQLLAAGDDQGALELLRKTKQGEVIAAVIINLVLKELQTIFVNRTFPMPPGLFSKLRRIIVLAGKEATYVQREQAKKNLQAHASAAPDCMLTEQATNAAIDTFINEDDNSKAVHDVKAKNTGKEASSLEHELENAQSRLRSVPVIWRIARQTRFIVLSSYMLYIGNPEQALWPAIEAANYYHRTNDSQSSADPCIQYLSRIALPIAAQAALLFGDFELASNLLELIEADTELPASERDQLEQMSVLIYSEYNITSVPSKRKDNYQINCGHCNTLLPPYCGMCEKCHWQTPICVRTGQPIKSDKMDKTVLCQMCRSLATMGKTHLSVCPLCHEPYQ